MTVVLLYHDVVDRLERETTGFRGPLAARYKLEPRDFAAHLSAIAATGLQVGTLSPGAQLPQVALTFDDAGASALAAAEAVERRGWRAHFFVPTSRIGKRGFLGPNDVVELARRGHVIGSHSHTHPTYMARLPRSSVDREWTVSREILGALLEIEPTIASVPGGMVSRAVLESAAAAGYRILMTSQPVSALRETHGMLAVGRYSVRSTTTAARAAAYARGAWPPRARLWLEWNAKTMAKRVSPAVYQRLRLLRARRV